MKSILVPVLALVSLASAAAVKRDVDPRYTCTQDSDCAVVNHGNCCGYYPVCAHPDATWSPDEVCAGGASVCGWPNIENCACIDGACNGMQGGHIVTPPME